MSMPSNRILSVINYILSMPPDINIAHKQSGRSRGVVGRGKNRADHRKGYNKVKK